MATISIKLDTRSTKKDGTSPIVVLFSHGKNRAFRIPIGISLNAKEWDSTKGIVKSGINKLSYNHLISTIQSNLKTKIFELEVVGHLDSMPIENIKTILKRVINGGGDNDSPRVIEMFIDKAMQAVSAHIRGRYCVPELASAVNVSPTHLSNLFQRYLGVSPAKYITRIRIEECKSLLCDGEMSVGEIAALMGYSSIPHFCKQFRQWVGCSPATFARQHETR